MKKYNNWIFLGSRGEWWERSWSDECDSFWCICNISFSDVRSFFKILELILLQLQQSCFHIFHFTLELSGMWWCFQSFLNTDLWWWHVMDAWLKHKQVTLCLRHPCWNKIFTTFDWLYDIAKTCLWFSQLRKNPNYKIATYLFWGEDFKNHIRFAWITSFLL